MPWRWNPFAEPWPNRAASHPVHDGWLSALRLGAGVEITALPPNGDQPTPPPTWRHILHSDDGVVELGDSTDAAAQAILAWLHTRHRTLDTRQR